MTMVRVDLGEPRPGLEEWLSQWWLSGLRPATHAERLRWRYDDGAIVPSDKRDPVPPGLLRRWRPGPDDPAALTIEFADFGEEIARYELEGAAWPDYVRARLRSAGGGAVAFDREDCYAAQPDCSTTTPNRGRGTLAGFHIDNVFAGLGSDARRLGICVGPGEGPDVPRRPAHWLVVAFSDELERRDTAPTTNEFRELAATAGEEIRCLHIPLDVGMGYLLPGGLIGHVGSGLGVQGPCTMAFFVGYWPRGAFAPAVL
jgi:hypothetical protein